MPWLEFDYVLKCGQCMFEEETKLRVVRNTLPEMVYVCY